jgi:hypothetical protein
MEVDVPAAVSTLSAALSTLEAAFEPLAATPLKDLLNNEEPDHQMDPIEQARTQILTAYLVHDLIWSRSPSSVPDPATSPKFRGPVQHSVNLDHGRLARRK